jgi:hypothetical protein
MAYTYTSKFVQLTPYLLMEYRYADEPTPETYFTNTGTNTVGFNKLVNGYRSNSIQIFNPNSDSSITNNTANTSVVRYSEFSFVSLDQNLIVPFNDFSDELTNTTNLPITFPSNLLVVYDTVRYHVRAGYNLSNIDGLIASIEFPDQNGNYVTMSQILIQKGTNQEYDFNPSPISIGSAIYDKYIEIKIPNLKDMNDKYLSASDFFKPSTLAGLISQSGTGFIYGSPLRISLWQVNKITSLNGYDRYESAIIANLSLEQEDPFSNIGATIKESDQGQFFEYYATDNEGFVEDFILFQNSIGNSYFISHQIQVVEQIGAAFIETSRFETIQTTGFDVPNYYRPIVRNSGVAASFSLRYTMSLINNKDQSRVIRIGTYTSNSPSEWGTNITPIQLSTFPQVQKIYNRVYGQASQNFDSFIQPVEIVKYVNNIVEYNYITTVFSNLTLQNASTATTGSEENIAFGLGKLNVEVSPFDNLYKFKIIKTGPDGSPTDLDLTSFGTLRMVFIQEKGEKLNIPSLTDNTIANPSKGEVAFKVDTANSSIVLNLNDKRFFITSGDKESDPNKSLDPEGNISSALKGIRDSVSGSIKNRSLNRANALNASKSVSSTDSFSSSVLYWGYWKASGDDDVVPVSYSGNRGIGLESIPSVQIPINPPPKSPSMPSINTITPSASQTGATGAASQQEVELSSLTGTALTNSVITGIKNIFNLQDNLSNVSQSVIVNSLNDLYSQYPQLSKSQFLTLYTRATNNLTGYSPLTVQAIKVKLNSELE